MDRWGTNSENGLSAIFFHVPVWNKHFFLSKFHFPVTTGSSLSKTKYIFNRPISRYYSVNHIHVIAAELQLTKTMSLS